jgi:hypothetical protein
MDRKELRDILPVEVGGRRVLELAFNAPSQSLIAMLGTARGQSREYYVRGADVSSYRPLQLPLPTRRIGHLVSCQSSPVAFFFAFDDIDRSWQRIHRVALPDGEPEELPAPSSTPAAQFQHAEQFELLRVWLSDLLAASADASTIYVNLGMEARGPDARHVVRYVVAEMSVADGSYRIAGELLSPYA